ncbi:MAG: hypothetical protein RLZ75_433 [Pseudomonadota bacterium]|jgi:predicted Zn finger-like uncharacterized protein
MEIVCKHCNTSHFLSDDRIPLETKTGKCKQCNAPMTVLGKNAFDSIELSLTQLPPPEPEATKHNERLMNLLEAHATDGFYIGNNIPQIKLENAITHFQIDSKAIVIALIDCTVWGSCKKGLAITDYGLYWNNTWGVQSSKTYLSWKEFIRNKSKFGIESYNVILLGNNIRIYMGGRMKNVDALNLFHALAEFDTHNITNNSSQFPLFKFDFTKASSPLFLYKTALQMKPKFHHGSCPNCGHGVSWKHYFFSFRGWCCEVCVTELRFEHRRNLLCTGLSFLWIGGLSFFVNSPWIFLILICIGIQRLNTLQRIQCDNVR